MLRFLWNLERKRKGSLSSSQEKQAYAKLCGEVGIGLNLFLFAVKFLCGMISGSISIQADAVNNLTDVAVALIALAGVWVAGIGAGKNHPFGHGRFEWITGLFSSTVVIVFGANLAIESLHAISHPAVLHLNGWIVITLLCSIGIKGYMYYYNHSIGEKIQSISMKATAADSLGDMVSTLVILISVLIGSTTGINLDGFGGLAVAVFIMISGIQSMTEAIERILGQNADPKMKQEIEKMVEEYPVITGIREFYIHDYGMGHSAVSMHIEGTEEEARDELTTAAQKISYEIYKRFGCEAAIQADIVQNSTEICERIETLVKAVLKDMQADAYMKQVKVIPIENHNVLSMEIACDHMEQKREEEIKERLTEAMRIIDPDYRIIIRFVLEVLHRTVQIRRKES